MIEEILKKSLFFAGAAGLMSSGLGPLTALAQTIGKPLRRADRYEDTYIFERKPLLYADSRKHPRVMGIPLHPMLIGQPLRIKYLQQAIAYIEKT